MQKYLEEVKGFLEGANSEEDRVNLLKQTETLLKKFESGDMKAVEIREFWIFWGGNQRMSVGKGDGIADAFSKLGYGAGAVRGCDWYESVRYGRDVISSSRSWPNREDDRDYVLTHFETELTKFFDSAEPAEYEEALHDLFMMIAGLFESFGRGHGIFERMNTVYQKYMITPSKL